MVEMIEEFLNFLQREKGATENTIGSYRTDLRQFSQFCSNCPVLAVDQKLIKDYFLELRQKGYADPSIGRKLACLRAFFNFLEEKGLIQKNPAKKISYYKRAPRTFPKALTKEETERFLKILAQSAKPQAIRDLAIIELILATGLKVSEIVNLDIQMLNLDPENPTIKIIRRKKEKFPFQLRPARSFLAI